MRVSLNTIKQFTDINLTVDELVTKINSQLGAIESTTSLSDKYKDAIIVRVEACEKHPAADRLNVCLVDDNGVVTDVERDENGYVQVVCGAPNVQAGMFAVWLPPRSVVPSTYEDSEPFVLGARELRGIMSQGMLAAADELAIGSDHDGILELNPSEWKPNDVEVAPGVSFALAYGLDDTIIDIENKMLTHRPDLFGQLGIAREIAGIQHTAFTSPDWYVDTPKFAHASGRSLEVFTEAGENVPRFMATVLQDIEVKPSPLWLQCALTSMGSKPINNIVDVTNYIMLLTAQPTHAYDYDKLRGHKLGARMAKPGETAELLNGKTYQLHEDDIVIVDGEGVVGLGGIMGGGNSEVSASTTSIVLEVANFDMYTVRKSSMRHGIFTDALTRFNKGQSPRQNHHIMQLLISSILDVSPGKQASDVYDVHVDTPQTTPVVTAEFINDRLGLELTETEITTLLENVELSTRINHEAIEVTPAFWRTDLELPEDIVEEVGRLYGFDHLPRVLPARSTKPAVKNLIREQKKHVRETLRRFGASEVLTYSFVHEKVIQKAGQTTEHAYQLSNALSPDLQYYRLSVTPSLLDKVHMNYKAGYSSFALFELGRTHFKGHMDSSEPTVPNESSHLGFIIASKQNLGGAAYYAALRYAKQLIAIEDYTLVPLSELETTDERTKQLTAPYEPARSAVLVKDTTLVGVIGEFTPSVRKNFKLPEHTAGFELQLDAVSSTLATYRPLSKFPSITQDISLRVSSDTPYAAVSSVVETELAKHTDITTQVSPVTIYQANDADTTKTITLRVLVTSYEKTLRDKDVNQILDLVSAEANTQLGAERI